MEHSPEMYYSYILVISHYISNTTHIYDLIYPTYENMKYAWVTQSECFVFNTLQFYCLTSVDTIWVLPRLSRSHW